MDRVYFQKQYLEWLCKTVEAGPEWHLLWYQLHQIPFVWIIDRDENRAEDGKYLRYLYSLECSDKGVSSDEIEEYLAGPCSVMEFLVGLARRIEDDIMYDADAENRTNVWFWEMVKNLGLDKYDDEHYSAIEIDDIVNRFMSRKYSKNGDGNVFKIGHKSGPNYWDTFPNNMEIWSQVHAWANNCIS